MPQRSEVSGSLPDKVFRRFDGQKALLRVIPLALISLALCIYSPRSWSQSQTPVATISAANFRSTVAPDSIVASFGIQLATGTKVAETVPLPTSLLGTVVTVRDSSGASLVAPLLFVSPNQINYIVPAQATSGAGTVVVTSGDGKTSEGRIDIAAVAPAIFTANQDGTGVPAADVLRVLSSGAQSSESPYMLGPDQRFVPKPIDLGPAGEKVFLILYLTGVRGAAKTDGNNNNGSAESVKVFTGGVAQIPLYAGPQGSFAGLDQINLEIPRSLLDASLAGSKQIQLFVKVDGFNDSNLIEIALAPPAGAPALQITDVIAPDKLLANTTIQLTGTGISAVVDKNKVSFGEGAEDPRPGEVRSASASQVSAVVPFGVQSGAIALNSDGKRWTSTSPRAVRTSFSAVIKDTEGQLLPPIAGAKVCFPDCTAAGALTTTLQSGGWFVLPDPPVGSRRVFVIEPSGQNPAFPFNRTVVSSPIVGDRDNHLPQDIFLQAVYGPNGVVGSPSGLTAGATTQGATAIADLLNLSIAGFRFSVPAGAQATFPDGSNTGQLTLTPVKNSLTPVPLPEKVFSSAIVQISPFGVKLNPGGTLVFPNPDNLPSSRPPSLYKYDVTNARFVDTGVKGIFSADGHFIETPAGAITESSIYLFALPAATTTIVGRVVDSDGVTPVRGVVVLAKGRQATTDGNGAFSLQDIPIVGTSSNVTDATTTQRVSLKVAAGITVTASYLRPSGRTDTASGTTGTPVESGITNLALLRLSGSDSNRPPSIFVPGIITLYVTENRETPVVVVDPDGQAISSLTVTGAAFATVQNNGGGSFTLKLAPKATDAGNVDLTLEARDAAGATTSLVISVFVRPAPIATPLALATNEDTALSITLAGFDAGSAPLAFAVVSTPQHGSLSGVAPNLLYKPTANYNGNDSFTFTVSNGTVLSAPATVSIRIDSVNDPPVLIVNCSNGPTIVVGETLSCVAEASDVDGQSGLTFSATDLPGGASFNPITGGFEWTPKPEQTGLSQWKIIVTDNGSPPLSDSEVISIVVDNPSPVLGLIAPNSAVAGDPPALVTLTGSGFLPSTEVRWNGSARPTTFIDSTHVSSVIPAGDLALGGLANVSVFNPGPGGGTSNSQVFTINNPAPLIASLVPSFASPGGPAFDLTVNGSGFVPGSVVRWNGAARTTTFINSTSVTAAISAADIAVAGSPNVDVFNPAPGGGTSNSQVFTINNPAPVIGSLVPSTTSAGGPAFELTVNGSGFVPSSVVRWNGAPRTTTFVNPTTVTAAISAADIAVGGSANVNVFNPAPGGGTSSTLPFTITDPTPAITGTIPPSAQAGDSTFVLIVNGQNFVPDSVVRWVGSDRVTTYNGPTQLTAQISSIDIQDGGTFNLTVFNTVSGLLSAPFAFTVNNPAPVLSSLLPDNTPTGSGDTMVSVNGSNFVPSSVVRWNGSPRTTLFVNSTQLAVTFPAADLALGTVASITVNNPTPGGGTSSAASFSVVNPAVPVLGSSIPNSGFAGSPDTPIQITGSNFVPNSVVRINGADRSTSYVSPTVLNAVLLASDLATTGTKTLTVFNPAPGGGISNSADFTISNALPVTSSINPTVIAQYTETFVLTVNGSGFVPTSIIRWNGADRTTTFVNSGQLTATIFSTDVQVQGTADITVFSPTPGGGTSAPPIPITIGNPVPVLNSLSPPDVPVGSGDITLFVNGSNFNSMSEIRFNGVGRTTFFSEETLIRTTVTAAEMASLAVINVTVFNPAPAGGTSGGATFSIVNPLPVTTLVAPTQLVVGSTAQEINVMGTDFVPSSVGLWNGNPRTTTYVSSTELTVSIPASDLTAAGDNNFAVMTPAPGGGTSAPTVISVVNPQPVLVQLLPPTVVAGSPDFLMTVNGTDFVNGIQLLWNGSPRASTFVNSGQFTVLIPAADVALPGGVEVSARNPAPALADASTVGFTVTGAPFAPGGSEEFSNTWKVTGPLNIGRTSLTATRLQNGAVLITGGHALFADGQIGSPLAASELFDPVTGNWQVAGNMQIARVGHSATFVPFLDASGSAVDGFVLVVGGDSGGGLSAARTAEMFSARDRRWRTIEAPLFGHIGHTATLLADGRVIVVGGEDGSGAVTSAVEIYDPRTGQWTAAASLNTPRSAHTAELLNDGRVMIIGGRNLTSSLTSIEIFDPGSGSWSESEPLSLARKGHTSTLLADGRVLVAGGATENTAATAELFDPLSGKWTDAGRLIAGRSGHVAATLEDGRILVGGGQDSDGNILTSCETFDPRTGKWTSAARLNYSRTGHAALVLENGRILVAGGRTGTSKSREDAPPANPRSHIQRQR